MTHPTTIKKMEHIMASTSADKAREAARGKDTGKFGTQTHADSGTVQAGPVAEESLTTLPDHWYPHFEDRHPGTGNNEFYVRNVVYLQGTVGVVIRDPRTTMWRIANHLAPVAEQPTYPTREAAAAAEYLYARTPAVIRRDLAKLRTWPTTNSWATPHIAEGEKLLTDNGLPLEA